MVENIEKLDAKFNRAVLAGPGKCDGLSQRHVQVFLAVTINYSGSAIPKGRPNPICTNDGRGCQTRVLK